MRSSVLAVLVTAGILLACGGGGGEGAAAEASASAEPKYGAVAYQKYESGTTRIKFKTESTVEKTWRNMSGDAPQGTFTHDGDLIVVTWDPKFTNHGARETKFRQLSDCSLAEFYWKDADGIVHDDDSDIWQRTEPKCPK